MHQSKSVHTQENITHLITNLQANTVNEVAPDGHSQYTHNTYPGKCQCEYGMQ